MKCNTAESANYICSSLTAIKFFKNLKSRESRVGEVSGYVNKGTMHATGSKIVYYEDLLSENRKNYRKATGKNFDEAKCKGYEYAVDGSENQHPVYKAYEACGFCY